MNSANHKKYAAVLISVLMLILPETAKAERTIFDGLENTEQLQEQIINEWNNDSGCHLGGHDDYISLNLCIHAFLKSLDSINVGHPEVLVLGVPDTKFGIGISTDWSKERLKKEISKVRDWVDQYPFELAPSYECTDLDSVLTEKKIVIVYDCYQHSMEQEIKLKAFLKDASSNKLATITIKYSFQLAFIKDMDNKEKFKESRKQFFQAIKKNKRRLVSKKGILLESFKKDIGWGLTGISIYPPHYVDYKPGDNLTKLMLEYGNVKLPEKTTADDE